MSAKEFERDFWTKNNPMTTPIWKCLEAYHKAELDEVSDEDIRQEAFSYEEHLFHDYHSMAEHFREGAKWMLKHLNNK